MIGVMQTIHASRANEARAVGDAVANAPLDAETLQKMMGLIYSRCRRLLSDPEQAWDATQEVFTRFYEARGRQVVKEPMRFLYRSSTNYCIDLLRVRGRTLPIDDHALEQLVGGPGHRGEGRVIVQKLIARFGREAVEMMTCRYVDQMTYQEIADIYDLSDRGVQKKLERIEEMMRKYLNR